MSSRISTRFTQALISTSFSFLVGACDSTSAPIEQLEVTPAAATLIVGNSVQLSVKSNVATVGWSSSSPAIASIDANGIVSGIKAGNAVITAETASGAGSIGVAVVSGPSTLSAKITTTCALTTASTLYCWGTNEFGQMGIGNAVTPQLTPRISGGGMTFSFAAVGGEHSCGISAGDTFCWGFNSQGNIGDGSPQFTARYQPSKVLGGAQFVSVDVDGGAGNASAADCSDATCSSLSCGVTASADGFCWGGTPAAVAAPKFFGISVGFDYQCGLSTQHQVFCWGSNRYRQAGAGTNVGVADPLLVDVGHPVQEISANRAHTCAVTVEGFVYCWGANTSGQLGAPAADICTTRHLFNIPCRSVPARVITDQLFQSVSVGSTPRDVSDTPPASHTCAVTAALDIYCWGSNVSGQLGNGTLTDSQQPVRVLSTEKFTRVVTGVAHSCALTTDGVAYCWGVNNAGQLGNGTTAASSVPVKVTGGLTFR